LILNRETAKRQSKSDLPDIFAALLLRGYFKSRHCPFLREKTGTDKADALHRITSRVTEIRLSGGCGKSANEAGFLLFLVRFAE